MPTRNDTKIATFADDTTIIVISGTQIEATKKLQESINSTNNWMQDKKIKPNESKSTHITFTLRRIDKEHHVYLNEQIVPQKENT